MISDALTLLDGVFTFCQQLLNVFTRSASIFSAAIWLPIIALIISVFFLRSRG